VKVLIRGRATVLGTHTYSCSNPRATTRKTAPASITIIRASLLADRVDCLPAQRVIR
jgi:hypothetical protein